MTDKENMNSDISILGQMIDYPKNHWGVLTVFIVCTAVAGIFYILFVEAKLENLNKVLGWSAELVTEDKVIKDYNESYIVEFWTPSPETNSAKNIDEWEKNVTEEKLIKFGHHIKNKAGILGYRRYLVFGDGDTKPKKGHWWVTRVGKSFDKNKFALQYKNFWKKKGAVYMEINDAGKYGNN